MAVGSCSASRLGPRQLLQLRPSSSRTPQPVRRSPQASTLLPRPPCPCRSPPSPRPPHLSPMMRMSGPVMVTTKGLSPSSLVSPTSSPRPSADTSRTSGDRPCASTHRGVRTHRGEGRGAAKQQHEDEQHCGHKWRQQCAAWTGLFRKSSPALGSHMCAIRYMIDCKVGAS